VSMSKAVFLPDSPESLKSTGWVLVSSGESSPPGRKHGGL